MKMTLLNEFEHDIHIIKKCLIKTALKKGIYENFGQTQYRKLQDKYSFQSDFTINREINMRLLVFHEWITTFDQRKLEHIKKGIKLKEEKI